MPPEKELFIGITPKADSGPIGSSPPKSNSEGNGLVYYTPSSYNDAALLINVLLLPFNE